ncbi:MAG: hypothetical protein ACRCWR_03045 [Saezia sp.]
MDTLFQIFSRIVLVILGLFFLFCMFVIGAMTAMIMLVKLLWYRITGKESGQNINVKFWTMEKNAPRPSQRPMEDVTDVEVKEIIPPDEVDRPDR